MKKLISAGLALAMLLSAGSVFADDEVLSAPALIYNNKPIGNETSAPFITEGRTMLPFRYLLEEIGASVDYDEAQRTVKAEKDGIAIAFSLDDTYIDITKDGQTERVVQDVKNEIKEDRVYVPIRFMSEAFDLNVGWDDYERTAIIVDIPQYVKELEEKAPDFKRYMELASKLPESYTQTMDMVFDFNIENGEEKTNLNLGLDSELSLNDGAVQADAAINLETNLIKALAGVDISSLKDVKFTFMYNDGQFYAKTNLMDKLKEIAPDNEELKNISALVNSNTWFKADIHELFETLGLPDGLIDAVKLGLGGGNSEDYFSDVFSAGMADNLTSVVEAASIDMTFNMYQTIFGEAFTITENGEGNYDIKMSINKDSFVKMIESSVGAMDESIVEDEDFKTMMDAFTFNCDVNSKIENNIATSSDAEMVMKFDYEGFKFDMNLKMNSVLTPDTNKEIVVPDSSLNLIDIIKLFK